MSFAHLHVHSSHSLLDGTIKYDQMAKHLTQRGQSAVALTDHGTLSGAFQFQKAMTAHGIKPIVGIEAYVSPGAAILKEPIFFGTPDQKRHDVSRGAYTHLTLLAMNDEGLKELYKLQSLAHKHGFWYQPRMDLSWILETRNLLVLSGCAGSELSTRIRLGQVNEASAYVANMKHYLKDRFYIEVMNHGITDNPDTSDGFDEAALNHGLISLAEAFAVPVVATNDAHYCGPGEASVHDALLCVQTKSKLSDENRFRFTGDGFYLKSRAEMEELFDGAYLDATLEVAERIQPYWTSFAHKLRMPKVEGADLRTAVFASERYNPWESDAEREDRINYELKLIHDGEFDDYFLVLADAISWAKSAGIAVGPGRGSAGGSYVAYLLGITDIDPIPHGLLFERFINPERVSLPDIDVDLDDQDRDRVLDYLRQKHGEDKVAQIMTLGTIGAKAGLKDATRVLGHPYSMGEDLVGSLPPALFGRQPTLDELPAVDGPDKRAIVKLARGLEGLVRSTGVHAAGVVISPEPLVDVMPVSWKDGVQLTGFDAGPTEALGLVKMDFLGLRNLGIIKRTISRVGMVWQDLLDLPLDDPATYTLLKMGQTEGVFQLDSDGMKRLLTEVKPNEFNDIAAVLALYRPGPMGAGAHAAYAKRKRSGGSHSLGVDQHLDSDLADVLAETYGLFVYQEQVMRALQVAGGYSLGEADLLRKAMGKKDRALLSRLKPEFVNRVGSNYDGESAEALWAILEPFADYAFNKAHSVGYGMVSYWCAYLKAHHPVEYMAEVLSSVASDPDRLPGYLEEVRRMGISLLAPDLNISEASYTPTKEGIRMGLSGIKGFGQKAHEKLEESRPFKSVDDFFKRAHGTLLNIGTLRALVRSGAFDSLESRRVLLDSELESLAGRASQARVMEEKGYRPLIEKHFDLKGLRDAIESVEQYVEWENELLGISLSFGKMVLLPARRLTQDEWSWVADMIVACPGQSPVEVVIDGKAIATGSMVDIGSVRSKIAVVQHWFIFDAEGGVDDDPPWDL